MQLIRIGNELRLARKAKGLTISQAGKVASLNPSTISRIENGKLEDVQLVRHLDALCKTYKIKATAIVRAGEQV